MSSKKTVARPKRGRGASDGLESDPVGRGTRRGEVSRGMSPVQGGGEGPKKDSLLLDAEREWFSSQLRLMLERTKEILAAFGNESLNDEEQLEALCGATTLQEVVNGLDNVAGRVFRALFSKEEWNNLEASSMSLFEGNEAQVRLARMKRQKILLDMVAGTTVDLTVRDEELAEEQARLATESLETVRAFLGSAGLTGRASLKAVVVVPSDSHEEEKEEASDKESEEQQKRVRKSGRQKKGDDLPKPKIAKKAKVLEAVVEIEEQDKSEAEELESEEAEEEPKEEDDDEEEETPNAHLEHVKSLLAAAAEESKDLQQWLETDVNAVKTLRFYNASPPDVNIATVEQFQNPSFLKEILSDAPSEFQATTSDNGLIEKLGRLLSWWKLVRQCLVFAGIFAHLKSRRPKRKAGRQRKPMEQRYDELVSKSIDNCIGFKQAKKYVAIGRLVRAFPQLLYQTQFVLLVQWKSSLSLPDGTVGTLDKVFPKLLSDKEKDFWRIISLAPCAPASSSSSSVPAPPPLPPCSVCSLDDRGSSTFTCSGCHCNFHALCVGYPEDDARFFDQILLTRPTKGRGKILPTAEFTKELYCGSCLDAKNVELNDIIASVKEHRAVADFLNQNDCLFALACVPGDGYCIFGILEEFARGHLNMTLAKDTFCKRVAECAIECINEAKEELGGYTVEADVMKAFEKLAKERGRVGALKKGLWRDLETQYVLKGYAKLFQGRVRVRTYQNDRGQVKETGVYFDDKADNCDHVQDLYVLHWSTLDHYDELVPK